MRKPAYKKDDRIYVGPTPGKSTRRNSRRGCLCADKATYSIDCCEGLLINQGIGVTERGPLERGSFSAAFSQDFDIKDIRDY
jgi:hypothetical protein